MKISSVFATACYMSSVSSFNVAAPQIKMESRTGTSLNLFGKGGGEKKGPGMMDQLSMFKKAQEMATKKKKLDEDLSKETFSGKSEDGNVSVELKFIPVSNPMDPNPDYEATKFTFDDSWFESADTDAISASVTSSLQAGYKTANEAVTEKYQVLQEDLMAAIGSAAPKE